MKKNNAKQIGRLGELMAAEYLKIHGYQILAQNYRWARGEIDIIVRDCNCLIFLEVKTCHFDAVFGDPETWVTPHKQRQIGQTALRFLQESELDDLDYRFDVIGVVFGGGSWYFKHLQDAFWL
jgi:putative endonuclease